ncbi:MAG: HPr family phosphocarrier protein [Thermoguttaceae bacterium]|nr:HPr family phosphocarrier protein [Thermoguttaceae bacterium]
MERGIQGEQMNSVPSANGETLVSSRRQQQLDSASRASGTSQTADVANSREVRNVVVQNHAGLHARASLALLNVAKTFRSRIMLKRGREVALATDMLQLLCLGAPEGTELTLEADGVDAYEAVIAVEELFNKKFYEDDMEFARPS